MAEEDSGSQLSPAMLAAIQSAIQAGFAGLQPLEAPPPQPALLLTTTPKLGLKMPALDDPALIQDINDNMVVLDNSITATQAVTLTNKTLDAPVINNPTITGWTNAQHTHLNAAGAGPLDGAAIATGTKGTGLLLRESGASGVGLLDPVVRDTLFFGAEPDGTPDTSLTRTAAGTLNLDGTTPGLGFRGDTGLIRLAPYSLRVPTGLALGDSAVLPAGITATNSFISLAGVAPDGAGVIEFSNRGGGYGANTLAGRISFVDDQLTVGEKMLAVMQVQRVGTGTATGADINIFTRANAAAADIAMRLQIMRNGQVNLAQDAGATAALNLNNPTGVAALVCQMAGQAQRFWITEGTSTASNARLYASGSLELDSGGNYVTPARDGVTNLGATTLKWAAVHANNFRAAAAVNLQLLNLNDVFDVLMDGSGHLRWRRLPSGTTVWRTIYSLSGLFMDEEIKPAAQLTISCGTPSNAWLNVYTNNVTGASTLNLAAPGGAFSAGSMNTSTIITCVGYTHPGADATMYFGHPSYRWAGMYSSTAVVVGSSADLKEDFAPLDQAACVEAVLGTDWLSYTYKAPVYTQERGVPEPPEPKALSDKDAKAAGEAGVSSDTVKERAALKAQREVEARANHAKAVEETAVHRKQKGYALGHETYKVHDLFGLEDRKNRSDGADLAVVACALQSALQRIEALEAAQAPASASTTTRTRRKAS